MEKIPDIRPGDLVKVYTKIIEGDKERIAPFQGVVVKIKGSDISKTFTVRKVSAGIGIERIFPLSSPLITKIELKKRGKVRRAKLTYLRQRKGRRMKIREAAAKPGMPAEGKPAEPEEQLSEEASGEGTPGHQTVEKV